MGQFISFSGIELKFMFHVLTRPPLTQQNKIQAITFRSNTFFNIANVGYNMQIA